MLKEGKLITIKMDLKLKLPRKSTSETQATSSQAYAVAELAQSWEIWHRRLGHIGYSQFWNATDGQ